MINVRIREDAVTPDLKKRLRELSPPEMRQTMAEIGREFIAMTKENFGVNKPNRPDFWPALSPNYQKRIKYYGPPKLILTGRLMNSIQIGHVFNSSVTVDADSDYAAVHQFGGGNNIPARPYFPVVFAAGGYALTPYAAERINSILRMKFS